MEQAGGCNGFTVGPEKGVVGRADLRFSKGDEGVAACVMGTGCPLETKKGKTSVEMVVRGFSLSTYSAGSGCLL